LDARAALPLKVSVPRFTKSPSVTEPDTTTSFEAVREAVESLEIRPLVNVSVPVPSAALFANWIAPALRLTPPLNVLVPPNVNTALPFFTKLPAPLITPEYSVLVPPLKVRTLSKFTNPAPATEAISSLLATLSPPPELIVTAIAFTNALPPLRVNVPSFTAVVPLNVFTPLNVNSAAPVFTRF
jgi:hypothetical protein